MELYVGYANHADNFKTIREALLSINACPLGSDEDSLNHSFCEKTFPAPESFEEPVTVYIAPGYYFEKLVITRPNLTLIGENKETTTIAFNQGAYEEMPDGTKRGTFRTATVRIDTHDFTASNITFLNNAGIGSIVGQALALYVDGDRNRFENCNLIGSQDTLFTAPLPEKEAKPGGFRGPGEFHERVMGRHYYHNCTITGDVDFIFGSATCIFDCCTIFSKNPGNKPVPESGSNDVVYGYVTAASTPVDARFGYVFMDCNFKSDCPDNTVYLGRPWREYAKTVFLNCNFGSHIRPEGYTDWGKNHSHFYYAEFNCHGLGSVSQGRVDYAHILTEKEAREYTIDNIFGDWKL